jgi:predicted translin family RNA/ssDNA-binding protein
MYTTVWTLLETIAPDLTGINAYRYYNNISGGLQELMEAILFQHYLETQTVLSHDGCSQKLPPGIHLSQQDYLLGLFDMTGELMRFAITYMATNGKLPGSTETSSILSDMQLLTAQLEGLDTHNIHSLKDFTSKMRVSRQSVEKVENGVYSMLVRGKERPKGWRPDTGPEMKEEVESY